MDLAIKGYSTFPRSSELVLLHQILFCSIISRPPFVLLSLCRRYIQRILSFVGRTFMCFLFAPVILIMEVNSAFQCKYLTTWKIGTTKSIRNSVLDIAELWQTHARLHTYKNARVQECVYKGSYHKYSCTKRVWRSNFSNKITVNQRRSKIKIQK